MQPRNNATSKMQQAKCNQQKCNKRNANATSEMQQAKCNKQSATSSNATSSNATSENATSGLQQAKSTTYVSSKQEEGGESTRAGPIPAPPRARAPSFPADAATDSSTTKKQTGYRLQATGYKLRATSTGYKATSCRVQAIRVTYRLCTVDRLRGQIKSTGHEAI